MILYGSGEPIERLEKVGRWVRSVHCKDGKWAKNPGQEWGTEVPLGEGDVGMERYLRTLDKIGYTARSPSNARFPRSPNDKRPKSAGPVAVARIESQDRIARSLAGRRATQRHFMTTSNPPPAGTRFASCSSRC